MENNIPEKEKLTEWSFPKMEIVVKDVIFHSDQVTHEREQNETEEKNNTAALEQQAARMEIENIKKDYFRKIAILNHVLGQVEKPLATLDKELTDTLQEILKTAIRKIVLKELEMDPDLMKKMIEELCMLIENQNGVLNVFLSEEDFKKLSHDFEQKNIVLKVNPSLTEGDVIVKSNMNEIRAILPDRINQLLGIKNG